MDLRNTQHCQLRRAFLWPLYKFPRHPVRRRDAKHGCGTPHVHAVRVHRANVPCGRVSPCWWLPLQPSKLGRLLTPANGTKPLNNRYGPGPHHVPEQISSLPGARLRWRVCVRGPLCAVASSAHPKASPGAHDRFHLRPHPPRCTHIEQDSQHTVIASLLLRGPTEEDMSSGTERQRQIKQGLAQKIDGIFERLGFDRHAQDAVQANASSVGAYRRYCIVRLEAMYLESSSRFQGWRSWAAQVPGSPTCWRRLRRPRRNSPQGTG